MRLAGQGIGRTRLAELEFSVKNHIFTPLAEQIPPNPTKGLS